jgi:uncharacterized protein YggT (Ycf19 family)
MRARLLAVNLLSFFVTAVEGFLALRFLLKLFGANPTAPFVSWIYDMTQVLLEPFRGIFGAAVLENRYIVEFSTLFAMLMYAILALLITYIINFLTAAVAPAMTRDEVVVEKRRR